MPKLPKGHATIPFMKIGQNMKGKNCQSPSPWFGFDYNCFSAVRQRGNGKQIIPRDKNLCTTCLHKFFTKRRFTKLLAKGQTGQLKNKVQRQVRNTRQGVCSDYCSQSYKVKNTLQEYSSIK